MEASLVERLSMVLAIEITYPPVPSVFGISPHGILAGIGIAVGFVLLGREVRRRGVPQPVLDRAVSWGVLAGIVGARAYYVVAHLDQYESVVDMLRIWEGGLGLLGGLTAGVLAAYLVIRRTGAHIPRILDAAVPMIALAIGIGRIGDVLLTDHLGTSTSSPFGLGYLIRPGYDLAPGFGPSPAQPPGPGQSCTEVGSYYAGCAYHLTPVYDMLGAFALAVVLLALRRWLRYHSGTAAAIFGLWYGIQRLALDFTRGVDEQPILGLTTTQLVSIVLILFSASVLAVIGVRGRGLGDEPGDPPSAHARLLLRDQPVNSDRP